ncbi:MAG: carboxypeptidase regulatory-like domain-containing protein [Candidatus Aminicenantales bacterium]
MLKLKKFLFVTCLLILCFSFMSVSVVRAQSVLEGKLTGTVTDDKGELLPGVTVEITGPTIMGKRSAVSSARGVFVFLTVPPGTFTLTASLPGFKTYVQEDIILGAGSAVDINVVMQMGAIEEQVTVIASSPIVDVKTSTVDSRLDSDLLARLPTSRDAFYDLSLTTPGMFDVASSSGWLPSPTAYGGSSMENVFLVNGVNTTNPRGAAFGSLVKVNYNAVEEVRIVALGSKAEYGSYSGAAIDVLTKSGSNTFHGNAAYYTEIKSWFDTNQPAYGQVPGNSWLFVQEGDVLAGTTKTNWEGNFTLGGPIIKDKLWFYGAFDYIRADSLPVNWSLLNTYTGRYLDAKISAEPFRNSRTWVNYHYEHNTSTGWSWGSEPEWDTTMTYGPTTYNHTASAQWQYLPTSTVIFTAKYLGFWTDDQPHIPEDGVGHPGYINWWKWGTQYGIAGDFPYVEAQKSNRQTFQADMSYYAEDFLGEHDIKFGAQYTKGRGNWMGGYFQNYANFTYPLGGWWGYDTGRINIDYLKAYTWYANNAVQDGLLLYNNKVEMNPFLTVRTADSLGFFIDDQWSPTKRLTLNLGLRFDRMTTKYGEGKVYDYVSSPEEINGPPPVLRDRASTNNIFDFKTFSPRIGLTYQLTGDGKTVFRASYGRYYMPLAVEFLRRFGPDMQAMNLYYQIYMIPWDIADSNGNGYIEIYPFGGNPSELQEAVRQIYGRDPIEERLSQTDPSWTLNVAPGVKDMYTDQISLNIERELVKDFSISGTYIYKHAANLFVNVPINRETGQEWEYERVPFEIEPGNTVDLYSIVHKDYNGDGVVDGSDIAWIGENNTFRVENQQTYDGKKPQRTYQAMQLVLNKRYSNRWQGLASVVYSWSNGTAQRTMRQNDNMMGPMVTDDTWMGNLNYTINNMDGPLPFVPKLEVKASGSYTVPYVDLDLGLRFRLHTGRPVWEWVGYPTITQWSAAGAEGAINPGGLVRVITNTEPTYLPTLAVFDIRLERAFRIRSYGAVHVVLDVLNLFNRANVTNIDIGNWGRITGITDARRFRLSFMYQF